MKEKPKISVVMPVYNGDRYLAETVESILNQTFADFELIVINDGSTDKSLDILQKYQSIDSRIRLFSRENKGIANTLNEAVDLANGEWFTCMDADDISLSHRFERQLEWLEKNPADICGSWIQFFGTSNTQTIKYAKTDSEIKTELYFMCALANATVLIKTNVLKNLYYDEKWKNSSDYDLWVRAALNNYKMTNVQEVLFLYRQHSGQISNTDANQQHTNAQKICKKYWQLSTISIGLEATWIDEIIKMQFQSCYLPNMNVIDLVFTRILQSITDKNSRSIVFKYLTPAYIRLAGSDTSIVARWYHLHKQFGNEWQLYNKIKIIIVSIFRLKPSSISVLIIKKILSYFRK